MEGRSSAITVVRNEWLLVADPHMSVVKVAEMQSGGTRLDLQSYNFGKFT